MKHYFRNWHELETGFYRSMHVGFIVFLWATYILILVGHFYATGKFNYFGLMLIALPVFQLWNDYRRYGKNGKPIVSIKDDIISFNNAAGNGESIYIKIPEFEELIIYGPTGRRWYRFIKKDKKYIELVPSFGRSMEDPLIEFLTKRLRPRIKVLVKEPSTFFAAIRGDGP